MWFFFHFMFFFVSRTVIKGQIPMLLQFNKFFERSLKFQHQTISKHLFSIYQTVENKCLEFGNRSQHCRKWSYFEISKNVFNKFTFLKDQKRRNMSLNEYTRQNKLVKCRKNHIFIRAAKFISIGRTGLVPIEHQMMSKCLFYNSGWISTGCGPIFCVAGLKSEGIAFFVPPTSLQITGRDLWDLLFTWHPGNRKITKTKFGKILYYVLSNSVVKL